MMPGNSNILADEANISEYIKLLLAGTSESYLQYPLKYRQPVFSTIPNPVCLPHFHPSFLNAKCYYSNLQTNLENSEHL